MTLEPLLTASPAIKIHAFAALAAFGLGVVQLIAPKGTLPHRTVGWIWVVLMLIVSATAFFIFSTPFTAMFLLLIYFISLPFVPEKRFGGNGKNMDGPG